MMMWLQLAKTASKPTTRVTVVVVKEETRNRVAGSLVSDDPRNKQKVQARTILEKRRREILQ